MADRARTNISVAAQKEEAMGDQEEAIGCPVLFQAALGLIVRDGSMIPRVVIQGLSISSHRVWVVVNISILIMVLHGFISKEKTLDSFHWLLSVLCTRNTSIFRTNFVIVDNVEHLRWLIASRSIPVTIARIVFEQSPSVRSHSEQLFEFASFKLRDRRLCNTDSQSQR